MKKSLEQQQRELDDRWKSFEMEKHQWEAQMGVSAKQGSSENM